MKGRKKFLVSLLSILFSVTACISLSSCDIFLDQILSGILTPNTEEPNVPEEPHVHNWEYSVETTAPTCTDQGFTTHSCECGEKQVDTYVEELGHEYAVTYPTCELDGKIVCERENCTYEIVPTDENATETVYSDSNVELKGADLVKIGHSTEYVELTVVNNGKNGNICVDGGRWLKVCKNCATSENTACMNCENMVVESREIEVKGHAVTANWEVRIKPTATEKGAIKGYCEVCETTPTVTLPAITDENIVTQAEDLKYVLNENKSLEPTCSTNGTNVYDISYKGWSGQFDVTTSSMHNYNESQIDIDKVYKIEEIEEIFDINWETATKSELDAIGIVKYGNAIATCEQTGKISFTCSDCKGFILIEMIGDHDYQLKNTTPASCTAPETEHYVCKNNSAHTMNNAIGEALTHVLELCSTIKQFEKGLLVYQCTRDGCDFVSEPKEAAEYKFIENPAPTCDSKGVKVLQYKATLEDEEYSYIELGEIDYTNHWFGLNDKGDRLYIDPDRATPYTVDELNEIFGIDLTTATKEELNALGITVFGNSQASCSETGSIAFTCAHCRKSILINGVEGNCVYTAESTYYNPTCTKSGYSENSCSLCGATVLEEDESATATGHLVSENFQIVKYPTKTESGYAIITCENGCGETARVDLPAITAKTIENGTYTKLEAVSKAATCLEEGFTTYSFTLTFIFKDGTTAEKNAEVEVNEPIKEHNLSEFDVVYDGYKYTSLLCESCNEATVHSVEKLSADAK